MKKLLVILFLLIFCPACLAQEQDVLGENINEDLSEDVNENIDLQGYIEYYPEGTVFLDDDEALQKKYVSLKNPVSLTPYSVRNVNGVNYEEIRNRKLEKKHTSNEYEIINFSTAYKERIGNIVYGTTYGADIDSGEFEYNTKFFTKYEGKRFAMSTAIGKDAYTTSGKQSDFFYLTPEIKLGKGFVLKDSIKAHTLGTRQKNEIILKYTPQFKSKEDILDFEVGVGQIFYNDGSRKQVVRFETSLRL